MLALSLAQTLNLVQTMAIVCATAIAALTVVRASRERANAKKLRRLERVFDAIDELRAALAHRPAMSGFSSSGSRSNASRRRV